MVDTRPRAYEKARKRAEELRAQRDALRDELDTYDGTGVHKIIASAERTQENRILNVAASRISGNHPRKGWFSFLLSPTSLLLVWADFHPSSMSFLCRAQTTMSCYVTNFESLLLKEFSSNGMIKPLNAIISVAIFSVNFPLQRKKGRNLLQPFWIFISFFDSSQHLFHTIYN